MRWIQKFDFRKNNIPNINKMEIESFSISRFTWEYRGEGNSNMVIELSDENKVLRIPKQNIKNLNEENFKDNYIKDNYLFYKNTIRNLIVPFDICMHLVRVTEEDIKYINKKIEQKRPNARRAKTIRAGLAILLPDYLKLKLTCQLKNNSTFTVEIKPKQGWVLEKVFNKCPFCLHQYYKLCKLGTIKNLSKYCPLDLYSGDKARMKKAIENLIETPQNNFKVFKNGNCVFDENRLDKAIFFDGFIQIIIEALLKSETNTKDENLPKNCALERVLNMQKLNKKCLNEILNIYKNNLNEIDLKNYLIFSTARDCSIMITFQQVNETDIYNFVENENYYFVEVNIADLDLKPFKTIEKHYKQREEAIECYKTYMKVHGNKE